MTDRLMGPVPLRPLSDELLSNKINPATTYSPTRLPWQYHRHWRA